MKVKVNLPAGLTIRDTYEASPSRIAMNTLKTLWRDHTVF